MGGTTHEPGTQRKRKKGINSRTKGKETSGLQLLSKPRQQLVCKGAQGRGATDRDLMKQLDKFEDSLKQEK